MARLTEVQQKAVDAGTHVIDPVHGFVPKLPVTTRGELAEDAVGATGPSEDERIKAESAAIKGGDKR